MRNLRLLLLGALAALGCGYAIAQISNLTPTSFSGGETIVMAALGPGSEGEYATSGMLRNTTGGTIQAATSGTLTWPVPALGGGYTVSASAAPYSSIVYTGAFSGTQNLPAAPFDGQVVELINGNAGSITMTTAVTDGATQFPSPCLSAATITTSSSRQMYYLKATNTWYLMR